MHFVAYARKTKTGVNENLMILDQKYIGKN
jgi:hypothetical protein